MFNNQSRVYIKPSESDSLSLFNWEDLNGLELDEYILTHRQYLGN